MVKIFKARFWDEVTFFNHLRIHAFWCWNCKSFTCWIFIQGKFQNDYYVITKWCYVITRLLRNFKILYWNKKSIGQIKHWLYQFFHLFFLFSVSFCQNRCSSCIHEEIMKKENCIWNDLWNIQIQTTPFWKSFHSNSNASQARLIMSSYSARNCNF